MSESETTVEDFTARLAAVRERIAAAAGRAGRDPGEVRLVAVTKTHPAEVVREAFRAGVLEVGENKVQEGLAKIEELSAGGLAGPGHGRPAGEAGPRDLVWHLIGHLQSNKARHAVRHYDVIHSVDSVRLAQELDAMAEKHGRDTVAVLLQVNVSGEGTKSGLQPSEVAWALREILKSCPRVRVDGLMTIAPYSDDPEQARPHFRALAGLLRRLRMAFSDELRFPGSELSMGMTGDYEVAIEEGATIVRIGSALFGARDYGSENQLQNL